MSFKEYYENEWKIKLLGIKNGSYDRSWRSRWEFAKENINNDSIVLDVACGDGVLGHYLIQEKNCSVYGVDLCEYALNICKAHGIIAKQCNISTDKIPFEDNFFDYITMLCCLEHIIDPINAISESLRVLKPGGKLIVTLPNAVHFKNRFKFLFGIVPTDLLHAKPGEGMHIQFFNYKDEFEKRILYKIKSYCFKINKKVGDVKNPRSYNKMTLFATRLLIKLSPNLFSQYTHWIIEKIN